MTKILYIQTAFLGDVLLSIPSLLRLKSIYPTSHLTLLCRKGVGEIFKELRLSDSVIEINKKDKLEFSKTLSALKGEKFDILICPHQSYRSALISFQISAKIKIGFSEWWNSFVFSKKIKRDMRLPDALRQFGLLAQIDSSSKIATDGYLENKKIPNLLKMGLKNRIMSHPRYRSIISKYNLPDKSVFISPGSVWNTKRWTEEGFAELANKFEGESVVFIGSPDESELCERISKKVPGSINLSGKTSLFELASLMTTGKMLFSNDSGAMHLGSLAELPTVAIFGPTVLSLGYEPWQEKAIVVENKDLKCRPCGKHGHMKCPIGTHECMKSISSEEVYKASKDFTNN